MGELKVGAVADFKDKARLIVSHGETEIGVFLVDSNFYAYQNVCVHQGGPVCRGQILQRVVEVLAEDKTSQGLVFSEEDLHLVCPWHGYEFNLKTGRHPARPDIKLHSYLTEVRNGEIFVIV